MLSFPEKDRIKMKRNSQLAQVWSHEYFLGVWSFSVTGRNLLPLGHTFLLARRRNDASDYREWKTCSKNVQLLIQ